jgi:hypothetical protein
LSLASNRDGETASGQDSRGGIGADTVDDDGIDVVVNLSSMRSREAVHTVTNIVTLVPGLKPPERLTLLQFMSTMGWEHCATPSATSATRPEVRQGAPE